MMVCDKLRMNGWYSVVARFTPFARSSNPSLTGPYIDIYTCLTRICSLSLLYNKKIRHRIERRLIQDVNN